MRYQRRPMRWLRWRATAVFGIVTLLLACRARSPAPVPVDAGTPQPAPPPIAFRASRASSGLWAEIADAGLAVAFTSERSGRPQLHRLDGREERALTLEPGAHHLQAIARTTRVAIVSRVEGPAEQLVGVDLEDGGVRELTAPMDRAHAAQLSPDERLLVFESSLTHASSLAVLEWTASGALPRPLPDLGTSGSFQPALSRDGRVLFTNSSTGDPEIYLSSLDGGAPTPLTAFHLEDFGAVPSPDGRRFAFVSNREGTDRIFVEGLDGRRLERLMKEPRAGEDTEGDPVWMPDGASILVTIRSRNRSRIVLVEVASRAVKWTMESEASDQLPRPSPDGRFIAFVSDRAGNADVWVMRANGKDAQRLTEHPSAEYGPQWWSPSR